MLKPELESIPLLQQIREEEESADGAPTSFQAIWHKFVRDVSADASSHAWVGHLEASAKTRQDLQDVFRARGQQALDSRIKYYFYGHLTTSRFNHSEVDNQKALADLRYPSEWYPATRSYSRMIHLHVGPTNSGKTYHALQALEKAESGIYAGPLRLLAHEVFTRMNAKGKACMLVTGEERRLPENASDPRLVTLASCTVEMVPINQMVDVAVIDEIQMIGSPERGWAWTQALLGVQAKELHLCGEARTVPLIQELAASTGEELIIHRYERLSPLEMAEDSLDGDLSKLRKGDCIVSFSIMGIHALRKQIERQTGKQVATVYGSLPPETRAQQARLFNEPNNDYDYLVASDAVGMGLNLAIKRIIFEASSKFDGTTTRQLAVADIKQIAGRAGRYRTAAQATEVQTVSQDLAAAKGDQQISQVESNSRDNVGLVTTLEQFDLPIVSAAMITDPEPLRTAGIFPPVAILERFANYFPPGTPFSYIMTRLHELSQTHTRFHLCGLSDQVWLADMIEPVKNLTVMDRAVIIATPASKSDSLMWQELMPALATCIAEQRSCSITDLVAMPLEILEAEVSPSRDYLRDLERLHKALVAYLWLSYRFAGIFNTRALAFHAKGLVEVKIENALRAFSFTEASRKKIVMERQQRQKTLLAQMQNMFEHESDEQEGDQVKGASEGSPTLSMDAATPAPEQTSGDHFSAERDAVIFDEPEQAEVDYEQNQEGPSSFAQGRAQPDNNIDANDLGSFAGAIQAGERDGTPATFTPNSPTVAETSSAAANTAEAQLLSETDAESNFPNAETQEVASLGVEDDPPKSNGPLDSELVHAANVPPKHLAHLDVDATEAERDVVSRP